VRSIPRNEKRASNHEHDREGFIDTQPNPPERLKPRIRDRIAFINLAIGQLEQLPRHDEIRNTQYREKQQGAEMHAVGEQAFGLSAHGRNCLLVNRFG
jgi:hypothetical protein